MCTHLCIHLFTPMHRLAMNDEQKEERIEFAADMPGERLDKALVALIGERLSRGEIQKLIHGGMVTVNGARAKASLRLKGGESIILTLPPQEQASVEPEHIELDVVYEDDDLAVIDKPAGMVVHPGAGHETGTLVNAILARWPQIGKMDDAERRMGIVHRLDKETSGLILVAKHETALHRLMEQFQTRAVEKRYIALLERAPQTSTGRIEVPIGRDAQQRKRMAAIHDGKPAVTEYVVLERDFRDGQALAKVMPLTGRTHQIRVHMGFIGCPVVGDRVYGFRKQRISLKRLFLHATELHFDHPTTSERLRFESPLPPGLRDVLDKLRQQG